MKKKIVYYCLFIVLSIGTFGNITIDNQKSTVYNLNTLTSLNKAHSEDYDPIEDMTVEPEPTWLDKLLDIFSFGTN